MKTLALSIAGVPIRMELQEEVPMTDAFRPFLTEAEPVYTGRFRRVEALPEFDPAVLYTGNCYRVHPGGVRSFFDEQMGPQAYAVSRTDYEAGTVEIRYLPRGEHCVSQMDNSFFHLSFEGLLNLHRPGFMVGPGDGIGLRSQLHVEEAPHAAGMDPVAIAGVQHRRIKSRQRLHPAKPPGIHRLRLRQEGPEGVGHGNRFLQLHPDRDTGNGQRKRLHQDWKILMVTLSVLFS